jgi:hypothetical protein
MINPECQQVPTMQIGSYTIPPSSDYPFFITAKRYWLSEYGEQELDSDMDARTVILLHSTSFHKEIWEPFLQDFFNLVSKKCFQKGTGDKTKLGAVRDAWAIECPNHGESACLNLRLWATQRPQERIKCMCMLSSYIFLRPDWSTFEQFRVRNTPRQSIDFSA